MGRIGKKRQGGDGRRAVAAARAHHLAGRLGEAQSLYRQALGENPREAEALHGLGILAHQAGMHDHAIDLIGRAIAIDDSVADFHNNIGEAYRAVGRFAEAVRHYRMALQLQPASPGTLISLGVALVALNSAAEAEAALREGLRLDPENPDALNALGNALQRGDRIEEAAAAYRRAVALRPGFFPALANLANALNRSGAAAEAIEYYQAALAEKPDDVDLMLGLADALAKAGREEEAVSRFEQVLSLRPGEMYAIGGLISLLERMNRLDEARLAAERLVALAPGHPAAQLSMAVIEARDGKYGAARERLERLLGQEMAPGLRDRVAVELGKVLDRLGEYDAAFAAFRARSPTAAGDGARTTPDPHVYRALIDRMTDWVSADRFAAWPGPETGDPETAPIFFVGFPRSGTTLMETFLDSHPALAGSDEALMLRGVRRKAAALLGSEWRYPDSLDRLEAGRIDALRAHYRDTARALLGKRLEGRRLVDKLPLNIVHLGLVYRLFPEARVIVALRDPRDVVLSCFMQLFDDNDAMVHFRGLDSTADLYAAVMGLWRRYEAALPIHRLVYRYEDFVADPAVVVGRVFDFLGLEWDEDLLRRERRRSERIISTPSYRDVTKPVYRSAIGRWRRYRDHLAPVMPTLAPFVAAFGYEDPSN